MLDAPVLNPALNPALMPLLAPKGLPSVNCASCNLRELCLPVGLTEQELDKVDHLVAQRRKVAKSALLFRQGEAFSALYAVRLGFFKTCVTTQDGREQVAGFQMAGEIIGLDGIFGTQHNASAIALEDSEVCVLPFSMLEDLSREIGALQHHLHRVMSREIVRDRGVMLLLGSMRAEERLAAFILNLMQRMSARGFSGSQIQLRMSREEIGSYLGLKLETVSRTLSKLRADGVIAIDQRSLQVLDMGALRRLATQSNCV